MDNRKIRNPSRTRGYVFERKDFNRNRVSKNMASEYQQPAKSVYP
jgi:hypothetical protein